MDCIQNPETPTLIRRDITARQIQEEAQKKAQKKARAMGAQRENEEKQAWQAVHADLVRQSSEIQSALQSFGYRSFCEAIKDNGGDPMIICIFTFPATSVRWGQSTKQPIFTN